MLRRGVKTSLFLYLYLMKIIDLINDFNDGNTDTVHSVFGDNESFISFLRQKRMFHLLDPDNAPESDEWVNEYLIELYDINREKFYGIVDYNLGDVTYENGKFYFFTRYREELSELFCSTRNYDDSSLAKSVLSEDNEFYERYSNNTTDDVYRDVIQELSQNNLEILYKKIIHHLDDQVVYPETDLLSSISQSQGYSDVVIINSQNVEEVVDDEETMKYLLENYLPDINNDLYSLHANAFSEAMETEVWNDVWSELSRYFVGQGEWVSMKPLMNTYKFMLEIRDFDFLILNYLKSNKKYGSSGTLGYHGYFLDLLRDNVECLKLGVYDYPSSKELDKNINTSFENYFYV